MTATIGALVLMSSQAQPPLALLHHIRRVRAEGACAAGLDQLLLADLAGVSDRFLRDLEHGKPTVRLKEVLQVLDALGLTLQVHPR